MTEISITEPGVYDLPSDVYHADPVPGGSLSSTEARLLLPPSCPARYRYTKDNGEEPKREYDFGSVAHKLVLGAGGEVVVVDADNWRTKAAKAERDDAYAAGHVPLLAHEYEQAVEMSTVLAKHPIAAALFRPGTGQPERSLFWRDDPTGVWRRALLDWLPDPVPGRRLIIPDYKTCNSAEPDAVARAVADHRYQVQAAWYLAGAHALGLAGDDAAFVFVFQEKTPPYLVEVAELDMTALRIGDAMARRAIDTYCACVAAGRWPGYHDDVAVVSLPPYAENRLFEEYLAS